MKLYFTYNSSTIDDALALAQQTAEYADIIGIGSLLLYKEGIKAITIFKAHFPHKTLCAEAHVIEKAQDAITMIAQAGATYISVLAGSSSRVIKKSSEVAISHDAKIALDLINAPSVGQAALEAKTQGIDFLIFYHHATTDEGYDFAAEWHNVRDNTDVPIFIAGALNESNIHRIIELKPQGIIIGSALTKAENPAQTAHFFRSLI